MQSNRHGSLLLSVLVLTALAACTSSPGDSQQQDVTPPAEVTSLSAAVDDGRVVLTWIDPRDVDFSHVEVSFAPDGPASPVTMPAGLQTFVATSLTNLTAYTFTVATVDDAGNRSAGLSLEATPAQIIEGSVAAPPVAGATITLFHFTAADPTGALTKITEGTTSADGRFRLQRAGLDLSGPLLIVASGGAYVDEVTASPVSLGTTLPASLYDGTSHVLVAILGRDRTSSRVTTTLSPMSTIAAGRVRELIKADAGAADEVAVAQACTVVSAVLGVNADPRKLSPVDYTDPTQAELVQEYLGMPEVELGALLAGFSQAASALGLAHPLSYVDALAKDLGDGVVDGRRPGVTAAGVTAGVTADIDLEEDKLPLDGSTVVLAAAVADFLDSSANLSGTGPTNHPELIDAIASNARAPLINAPPGYAVFARRAAYQETSGSLSITGVTVGSALEEPTQQLTLAVFPSDASFFTSLAVVPAAMASPASPSSTASVAYTLAPGKTGAVGLQLELHDDGGTLAGGRDTFVGSFTLTIMPKALAIVSQPTDGEARELLSPPVVVEVRDPATGTRLDDATDLIALTVASGPEHGLLSGTLTQAASHGVASFADLVLGQPGAYILAARAGSLVAHAASITVGGVSDLTPPVPGATLSFADVTATSLSIRLAEAADDISAKEHLDYKVAYATSPAALATVEDVAAATANVALPWTGAPTLTWAGSPPATAVAISGLTEGTTYYVAALARDHAGNLALYGPQAVTTANLAPIAGAPISVSAVTATSTTVSWGAATDGDGATSLAYRLVRAPVASAIDTLAEVNAGAGTEVMPYTPGVLTYNATGLVEGLTYWLAVVVKDAGGLEALYAPQPVALLDAPPVPGTISFGAVSSSAIEVLWTAASDGNTPPESLYYKLLMAPSSVSFTLANAESVGTPVLDWSTGTFTATASSLAANGGYAFAVLVREGTAGPVTLYPPASHWTNTNAPPTLPATATLALTDVAATGLTVTWHEAADAETAAAALQYKIVYAASSSAYTTAAAVAAATSGLALDWTAGSALPWAGTTDRTASIAVGGLAEGTPHTFWAVVRDGAGALALYTSASATTLDAAPAVGEISFGAVTGSTIEVHWTAASDGNTPASSLYYKLVRGAATDDLSTVALADAATTVLDYTANTLTGVATGLSVTTPYKLAVIVREGTSGLKSLYAAKTQATTVDTTPPTLPANATLSFSDFYTMTMRVTVRQASDDITTRAALRYKMVYATSPTAYATAADVAAATSNIVWDWRTGSSLLWAINTDSTNLLVYPLDAGTTYTFWVVVQDGAGNMSLYTPSSATTVARVSIGEIAAAISQNKDGDVVSFGKTFSAVPFILVNAHNGSGRPLIAAARTEAGPNAPTTTGFTLKLHDLDNQPVTTNATVQWLAIVPSNTSAGLMAGQRREVLPGDTINFPKAAASSTPVVLVSGYDESSAAPVLVGPYNTDADGFAVSLLDADGNNAMATVSYLALVQPSDIYAFQELTTVATGSWYDDNRHLGFTLSDPTTVILTSAQKNGLAYAAAARNLTIGSPNYFDLSLTDCDGASGTSVWAYWAAFALE